MKTIVLLVLVVAGCRAEVDEISWQSMDDKVSTDLIMQACDIWSEVGVKCSSAGAGETANVVIYGNDTTPGNDGQTDPWHGDPIHVSINLAYVDAVTIAHEFGHCLGLNHLDTGPAIMNTIQAYDTPQLTPVDIAGYRALKQHD